MRKRYTEEELRKIISKKYHNMINWKATMFMFDGTIEMVEGYAQTALSPVDYDGNIRNVNWYLRRMQENPEISW